MAPFNGCGGQRQAGRLRQAGGGGSGNPRNHTSANNHPRPRETELFSMFCFSPARNICRAGLYTTCGRWKKPPFSRCNRGKGVGTNSRHRDHHWPCPCLRPSHLCPRPVSLRGARLRCEGGSAVARLNDQFRAPLPCVKWPRFRGGCSRSCRAVATAPAPQARANELSAWFRIMPEIPWRPAPGNARLAGLAQCHGLPVL